MLRAVASSCCVMPRSARMFLISSIVMQVLCSNFARCQGQCSHIEHKEMQKSSKFVLPCTDLERKIRSASTNIEHDNKSDYYAV